MQPQCLPQQSDRARMKDEEPQVAARTWGGPTLVTPLQTSPCTPRPVFCFPKAGSTPKGAF